MQHLKRAHKLTRQEMIFLSIWIVTKNIFFNLNLASFHENLNVQNLRKNINFCQIKKTTKALHFSWK